MGLVEGVVGKVVDLIVDLLCRFRRNPIGHTACNVSFLVTMNEGVPLPFNVLGLLFAHGAAHHIRLAQRVSRQLLEDLHHLLLVDDAPVGDGEDGLQGRVLVGDQLGVVLAGDEPGDGLHGAGAVEGHNGGEILDGLGLEAHAHAGHTRRLHLEHAAGLALGQHIENRLVVLRDVLQPEVRAVLLHHLHRVVQHRQVPQAQEVHL